MRTAIYPGSFDPITNGHLDVIERATVIFDKIIISVAKNSSKSPLFSVEERTAQIKDSVKGKGNIEVDSFEGLLVDYADRKQAKVIIRGLRAISDFEFESQMALMNRRLNSKLVTVFLMPNEKYSYLNSSIVKEIAAFQGDIAKFVTPFVARQLYEKFKPSSG